jgi:hypothetical protein
MANLERRFGRLEQQLEEEEEVAAGPPLIVMADRAARPLDKLTDTELKAISRLLDLLSTDEDQPELLTEEWDGGRQVLRIHLSAQQVSELAETGEIRQR